SHPEGDKISAGANSCFKTLGSDLVIDHLYSEFAQLALDLRPLALRSTQHHAPAATSAADLGRSRSQRTRLLDNAFDLRSRNTIAQQPSIRPLLVQRGIDRFKLTGPKRIGGAVSCVDNPLESAEDSSISVDVAFHYIPVVYP